ncbi:hypothetical protein LguiB_002349 [Lonicera macranthoides]
MILKTNNQLLFLLVLVLFILSFQTYPSAGLEFLTPGQSISGNQTLSSGGGIFELGFFTPGNSTKYYIGIWYKKLPTPNKTIVWVANRNNPVSSPYNSQLKLSEEGNLVLLSQNKTQIWSSNSTSKESNSTVALLLDNGNFLIRVNSSSSDIIWQSFDHPSNTWLPGGKVGYNKLKHESQILTSWRSVENPATSKFSVEVEMNGTSHILLWNRSKQYWSSGEWTGKVFRNVPEIQLNFYITNLTYISNENESYFTYEAAFPSALTRFVIDVTGQLRQYVWGANYTRWSLFWTQPPQPCEVHGFCGVFSKCSNLGAPLCSCMEGFEPTVAKDWEMEDHTDGCARKIPLRCGNDTFSRLPNTRFPDDSVSLRTGSSAECESACSRNCSCTGYAYDSVDGCFVWEGDLVNLQQLTKDDNSGKDFHVRVSASEESTIITKAKRKSKTGWIILGALGGFSTFLGIFLVIFLVAKQRRERGSEFEAQGDSLRFFKYKEMKTATKNFSEKLGEGGFGSVFKGTLPNSSTIAVKRLKNLKQGEKEDKQFRAEVSTIGLVQHINLVRLVGFCIKGTKRFLVYDYMVNGSLESHLFSLKNPNSCLDWKKRYNIALGTARGLAYLHEKCRDCIVHCDIKPENILLDNEFNSKVGDFGLAKLIGREFSRVLTTIRGTRGYLAPEWISGEAITPKADVFSFGMVLLEIISGKRNRDLCEGNYDYFPALVANRLNDGEEVITLLDKRLEGEADVNEVTRACRVAIWCLQNNEKERPSMGSVVQILEGVLEVGAPPIPRFLQGFMENQGEDMFYHEDSSI